MRKFLLTALLLMAVLAAKAVPACPEPFDVTQPDGTTLTLRLFGDEWQHITITTDGYTVLKNGQGYYVYAQVNNGQLEESSLVARNADSRTASDREFLDSVGKMAHAEAIAETTAHKAPIHKLSGLLDISKFRGLVVLVEYNDRKFTVSDPHKVFTDLVTQEGYTGYVDENTGEKKEYTGSVYDFFKDNSNGQFKPRFDVVGPVTVNYPQTYPSGSSNYTVTRCTAMFGDALRQLDDSINYKDYDTNGDGTVDMVFFVVAGGGANYGVNNTNYLWPHASQFSSLKLDGVSFGRYACSTELYGLQRDSIIDGIGTICHEFSHVLGLPDLYDVDYSSNGLSTTPGKWSIMAGGNYLNKSRTPAGFGSFERWALGWIKPEVINGNGERLATPLQTTNSAYRINSQVKAEYFLVENRDDSRWDACLPGHGLLVWRVDSTNTSSWTNNKVNINPKHNYYELIRACQKDSTYNTTSGITTTTIDWGGDPFPGTANVTKLDNSDTKPTLKSWTGLKTEYTLDQITPATEGIKFNVVSDPVVALYEPFEDMPTTQADTTGVTGTFAQWSLTKARIVVPDSGTCNGSRAVAILAKGDIHTTTPIDEQVNTIKFSYYNPTSKSAIVRAYYSVDGGNTWLVASPFDGQQYFRVTAGETSEGEFRVNSSGKQKTYIKISVFSGSSTEYGYIDDLIVTCADESGIGHVTSDKNQSLKVSRNGNTLVVTTPTDGKVTVIDATGAIVATANSNNCQCTVELPGRGFYVVTQAGHSAKVIF